ncbi:para-nitrobenzyl esterase [Mucilaginibacter frigoritolerans]|uniref:Carboxylic ester hydrolase n=2 Tax=Mucilaginibacter frigoritolerans TaxID=652788 RepID=A0A562TQV8_9SPHI|nr:para-nitrobenzyl esterase [Mucilaginibacter frigoritolerans]
MNKSFKIAAAFLLIPIVFICRASAQNIDPIVKTDRGYIKGLNEDGIAVFKGIPYAAPPVGPLRFNPPVEHGVWKDTLSAQKFGSVATQNAGKKVIGSEDCLSLNIYAPKIDHQKRAVLVWVHGGSMTAGAGKGENGHAFADKDDIVTVTINYRLGVFGFMYLGDLNKDYATSGNNGTLDCIMALSWIKHNIVAFGGDPNRITLMGESAGAKLISAVLVSPKSKGLFQQYIAESGSVQCIRDTVTARHERLRVLHAMGKGRYDIQTLLKLPADSLMKAQGIACSGIGGNSFFGPVADGVIIKGDPYQYAAGKNMPRIKALIGTNKIEAALFMAGDDPLQHPDTGILRSLFGEDYPMVYKAYQLELKTNAPYDAAAKVLTQYMYQMHSYRFAKVLVQNRIPVWMYRLNYDKASNLGAAHAAELQFVWNNPGLASSPDMVKKQLATNMHKAWVAFIKTGNPNGGTLPQWPNYSNDARQIMSYDSTSKAIGLKEIYDDKNFPSAVFVLKGNN